MTRQHSYHASMTMIPDGTGEKLRQKMEQGDIVLVTLTLNPDADEHDIQALLCTLEDDRTILRAHIVVTAGPDRS